MALSRYEHTGAAPATGLSSGIGSGDTSFSALSGSGYPTGAVGKFVICLDAGTTTEEKVLCSARSGTTFTVATSGRGYDGTTASSHSTGTTNVTHVLSAAEVDDTSDHLYTTTRDDHTQYSRTDGTRAFTGAVTVTTGGLTVTAGGLTVTSGGVTATGNSAVTGTLTSTAEVAGTDFKATGLTGATAGTRLAGGTASGAPVSGTFAVGDFVIDQTGIVWICAVAGTPGTWRSSGTHLMARYTRSAPFSPAASSPNIPVFVYDTLNYDTAGIYSVVTGMFTVPLAGVWRFDAQIGVQTDATHPVTPRIGLVATTSSSTALIEGPRQNIPVSVTAACVVSAELNLAANATVGVGQMGPITTGETGLTDPSITWVTARYVGTAS